MLSDPKSKVVLVLGGARSGKSSWALRYAERHHGSRLFVATARVLDEEMARRVELHKASRGPTWSLLEEPTEIGEVLRSRCAGFEVVLVDCLTIWLSNVLLEKGEAQVRPYVDQLAGALSATDQPVIMVSNEVGLGIVPENALGRQFRDLAGEMNQRLAGLADMVVFMAAGLPLFLKG